MKKDKYEELKPEVFEYESEKSTLSWMFGAVFAMIGFIIFFVMFVMTLFSQAANIIK